MAVELVLTSSSLRRREESSASCPEGEECGNDQPEQALYEEKQKSPKAESFDPGGELHAFIDRFLRLAL